MTRYTPLWLQAGTYPAGVDRRLIGAIWPAAASTGLAVTATAGMAVNVAAGTIVVPSQNNTGSTLCASDATEPVTLAAAPAAGTNRYDLVVAQARGTDLDGGANNDWVFTTVTGVAAATPTVPAVPAGAAVIAQVYVPGGSASVTQGNITDRRPGFLSLASTIPPAQATGSGAVTFSASGVSSTLTVTFPVGRFTAPPTVMLVVSSTSYIWASIQSNPTVTSFSTRAYSTSATQSGTFTIFWFATAA